MIRGGLAEAKDYPLSDSDIRKILGRDIKIHTYPQLGEMNSIDEMFDRKGRAILLFLTTGPQSGHWLCLIRRKDSIEFFDPYGEPPDRGQKKDVSRTMLEQLDEVNPYLTDLLRKSGKAVYYNTHDFQKDRADINTCGRHCIVRLLYAPYSLEKYKAIIDKSGLSPDDFVVGVTYDKLHK